MATDSASTPDLGAPQFASHAWVEPIIVVSIMVGSLIINRHRDFSIFRSRRSTKLDSLYDDQSPDPLLRSDGERDLRRENPYHSEAQTVFGITFKTPDSSRWADHIHSRILQKFPFLVEMFYWVVNYLFYSITKATSQWLSPAEIGVVQVAQNHAIGILNVEHASFLSFFFPIQESDFQAFFMNGHPGFMTFFNRIYSLVHIPGTVLFLSWYYYCAPDHPTFAVARRTMTLGNFMSFMVFCFFPCMPPRLLPKEYHFFDTVRQEHAESVWVGGKSVNQFAAMPSLHFTYAFVIGCTFIYHSGILQRFRGRGPRKPLLTMLFFLVLGIVYPLLVLSVIVATANHYWLDATVALFSVIFCFFINRVFNLLLPLEYCLCWILRIAKPVPTTGTRALSRHGRRNRAADHDEIEYTTV
ncbi:hypothetical protein ASPZODRAFT_11542 [Penicilliopsis zonata CBS 506.65]|uniref:Inositolphosphotransferase Aur1/Ipt1 domain-containing protein n=1 Tax=Penicilliopsis zonata CBS 506.65 TaxID=1073090 RepID=A0A1L9SU85_9EURO|nr:hypothetical protein ASPZODRAFT_11542 [Penicilliopsis zonata CBS 506.65]OJJ50684.1 hypothetical protein ASPZODRAFT_11542 [Penicilliopsis zonata CBS 506.65]